MNWIYIDNGRELSYTIIQIKRIKGDISGKLISIL